jgi:cell division protease FtsH
MAIDREVRKIIDECYGKAEQILEDNRHLLEIMKDALMEYETIDSDQIDDIMQGKTPRPPMGWSDSDNGGSGATPVEDEVAKPRAETSPDGQSGPIGGPAGEH